MKEALRTRGFTWDREFPFPNDDTFSQGIFRGKSKDGRKVFAVADYDDDEQLAPEIIANICRNLETDSKTIKIDCGDGTHVSVRPVRRETPPSRPALPASQSTKPPSN